MSRHNWYLIENQSHAILRYTSERKLREDAKRRGLQIKRSWTDRNAFYTVSWEYIPGGS